MRVLHVFKDYFPPTHGGIEHFVHDVVHGLGEGFECSVLTSSHSLRTVVEDDEGVRVVRAPELGRIGSAPITASWGRIARRESPDVIHFHIPNPSAELATLLAGPDILAVATYHAEIARARLVLPAYRPVLRRFVRRMRRVIVSSWAFGANLPALRGMRDRVEVIPFGIDPAAWEGRPPLADELRARHPGPIVLFLGRLVHYKGVHVLLEAMRTLDATLLVAGEGGKRGELESRARSAGLDGRVVFCGPVSNDDRAAYYHAADVFVLPSTSASEGFGLVQLEAMACGTPVVSTELGTGTSWVNVNGETGLVAPPGSPKAIASAVRALLSDDAWRARLGAAAKERVRRTFDRAHMMRAHAELYRRVMAGG